MRVKSAEILNDGMERSAAERLWDDILGFASYSFNKSHAVEYTLISYQSAFLKTHYPIEFYAAALTLLGDEKLPALLADAKTQGISIDPPDVNLSTERFEILTDVRLSIPFGRVKGLSTNAAKAIVDARGRTPFASKEEFVSRVNRRMINVSKVDILDRIGAFASIDPTAKAVLDPSRVEDQIELIPGLINATVPIDREMHTDEATRRRLEKMVNEYVEKLDFDGKPVRPAWSSKAKAMVIFDTPSTGRDSEESRGFMGLGNGFAWECAARSMGEVGFSIKDLYITALLKRPKAGKTITAEEIELYAPYLREEIDLLKPPIIVALGSNIARWFFPDLKGKVSEIAGQIIYHKELKANVVVGFSPGEIWHDPEKQTKLDDVFRTAMSLTDI